MPTQEERDRAMAVHSLDDQTRVHTGGDETETVMDAGGEIQQPPQPTDPAPQKGREGETVQEDES
jgi:hypothetical protein